MYVTLFFSWQFSEWKIIVCVFDLVYTYIKVISIYHGLSPIKTVNIWACKIKQIWNFPHLLNNIYLSIQILKFYYNFILNWFCLIYRHWMTLSNNIRAFFHDQSTLKHGRLGVTRVNMLIMTQFNSKSTNHVHIISFEQQWPRKLINVLIK